MTEVKPWMYIVGTLLVLLTVFSIGGMIDFSKITLSQMPIKPGRRIMGMEEKLLNACNNPAFKEQYPDICYMVEGTVRKTLGLNKPSECASFCDTRYEGSKVEGGRCYCKDAWDRWADVYLFD